jgi:hypothetical protein
MLTCTTADGFIITDHLFRGHSGPKPITNYLAVF